MVPRNGKNSEICTFLCIPQVPFNMPPRNRGSSIVPVVHFSAGRPLQCLWNRLALMGFTKYGSVRSIVNRTKYCQSKQGNVYQVGFCVYHRSYCTYYGPPLIGCVVYIQCRLTLNIVLVLLTGEQIQAPFRDHRRTPKPSSVLCPCASESPTVRGFGTLDTLEHSQMFRLFGLRIHTAHTPSTRRPLFPQN